MSDDVERPRGVLSEADRRYLLGRSDYASEQSERDARYRIRQRFVNGVRDLNLLLGNLEDRDLEQVVAEVSSEDLEGVRKLLEYVEAREEFQRRRSELEERLDEEGSA